MDAKVLARMGTALDLRLVEPPSPAQRKLSELKTARDTLTRNRTAVLNQCTQACHSLIKHQLNWRLQQIERQIKALNAEIGKLIAAGDTMSRPAEILTSIPGAAEVTAAALIAEMPELGQLDPESCGQSRWPGARDLRIRAMERTQLHPRRSLPPTARALHGDIDCQHSQSGSRSRVLGPARTRQTSESRPDRRHAKAPGARQRLAATGSAVVALPWSGIPTSA